MKIEAKSKTIRQIINDEFIFQIPDYQRKYSWTNTEIAEFLNDIQVAINNNTNHFFGTIVVSSERTKNDKTFEIIDGQQRITTAFILLYSLLTIYKEIEQEYRYDKLRQRVEKLHSLLVFQDDDGEVKSSKLLLNEQNNEFFNEYIVKGWDKGIEKREDTYKEFLRFGKIKQSIEVYNNYNIIFNWLKEKVEKSKDIETCVQELKIIQEIVLDYFELVIITVENDADAFLIFETLNDRGLDLTTVDLIKNELFKNCSKDIHFEQYKNKWLEMIGNFDDSNSIKKFIRHYWIANYQEVTHQNLFKAIRDSLKGSKDLSKDLIDSLRKQAVFYEALVNPNTNNVTNQGLLDILLDMKYLKYDLTHPLLLSAYQAYAGDEEKVAKVALLCRNFLLRHITICNNKPGSIESEIGKLARGFCGDISIISNKFGDISKDSELKAELLDLKVSVRSYSTYLFLVEIEKSLHVNEKWICPGRKSVTIEHILPQCIDNTVWKTEFDKDKHEVYVNRLGNLTLLGASGNSKIKNASFNDKKVFYSKNTDMKMTSDLSRFCTWTTESINDRQIEMANILIKILKLT